MKIKLKDNFPLFKYVYTPIYFIFGHLYHRFSFIYLIIPNKINGLCFYKQTLSNLCT